MQVLVLLSMAQMIVATEHATLTNTGGQGHRD